jgi:peroxiredoxin Q/BCP
MYPKQNCISHILVGVAFALLLTSRAWATAEVGSPAPDFCLPSSQDAEVCLKDFHGKDNVVLLFYILDFTSG